MKPFPGLISRKRVFIFGLRITMERIIGKYQGVTKGPLLICIGGMHGNEPAGVRAIDLMSKMLEVEPITNPAFEFNGTFLGLIGNTRAFEQKKRFLTRDMNRMFNVDSIKHIRATDESELHSEELEIKELLDCIDKHIEEVKPERVILLDLHTTSSSGGIFSIATSDTKSIDIAMELHAPVIVGMLEGIKGTTLHYFNDRNFSTPITPVTFESGQHQEELSINRAIAAITNCMRTIGSIRAEDVENRHDKILIEYSKDLPKVVNLVERYSIKPEDHFKMLPDYKNFQAIKKGEVLATSKNGDIQASVDGRILMPLYQKQGEEGFFIVQEVEGY